MPHSAPHNIHLHNKSVTASPHASCTLLQAVRAEVLNLIVHLMVGSSALLNSCLLMLVQNMLPPHGWAGAASDKAAGSAAGAAWAPSAQAVEVQGQLVGALQRVRGGWGGQGASRQPCSSPRVQHAGSQLCRPQHRSGACSNVRRPHQPAALVPLSSAAAAPPPRPHSLSLQALQLVPTLPPNLLSLLVQNMPHKTRDRPTQCLYLRAAFALAESAQGAPLREGLLLGVVEHLLTVDVEIRWEALGVQHGGCEGGRVWSRDGSVGEDAVQEGKRGELAGARGGQRGEWACACAVHVHSKSSRVGAGWRPLVLHFASSVFCAAAASSRRGALWRRRLQRTDACTVANGAV